MTLVTIATFSSYFDAHLIKGRLEHEGVSCFIKDENTVSINPMYDIAMGGIKLQVPENEVDTAREILKDTSYNETGSITTFNVFDKARKESSILKIILIILFALLILFFI